MSNFIAPTFHPVTGVIETANWLDDHFGNHHYGVYFPSDGVTYDPLKHDCEQVLPKAAERIAALEAQVEEYNKRVILNNLTIKQRDDLAAAANHYMNVCPADPDLTDEFWKATQRLQKALARLGAKKD